MINASARAAVLRFPHDPHLLIDDPDAPDAVVLLGLDLYHLLTVVGDCAEDMRRHAEGGVPAGKQFRALTAACDRATTIAQRLTSTEMLSWRDRSPIDIKLVVLDCAEMLECALGSRIHLRSACRARDGRRASRTKSQWTPPREPSRSTATSWTKASSGL